jgi:hypothetical protein
MQTENQNRSQEPSQTEDVVGVDVPRLVRLFLDLPLGARFRYLGSKTVWVSIARHGCGTVAKWEGPNASPVLQSICSAAETLEECETLEVELVDLPSSALDLAIRFHETYERLAPQFGYETRIDTRAFDPTSKNGKLMVSVCAEILQHNAIGEARADNAAPIPPTTI